MGVCVLRRLKLYNYTHEVSTKVIAAMTVHLETWIMRLKMVPLVQ